MINKNNLKKYFLIPLGIISLSASLTYFIGYKFDKLNIGDETISTFYYSPEFNKKNHLIKDIYTVELNKNVYNKIYNKNSLVVNDGIPTYNGRSIERNNNVTTLKCLDDCNFDMHYENDILKDMVIMKPKGQELILNLNFNNELYNKLENLIMYSNKGKVDLIKDYEKNSIKLIFNDDNLGNFKFNNIPLSIKVTDYVMLQNIDIFNSIVLICIFLVLVFALNLIYSINYTKKFNQIYKVSENLDYSKDENEIKNIIQEILKIYSKYSFNELFNRLSNNNFISSFNQMYDKNKINKDNSFIYYDYSKLLNLPYSTFKNIESDLIQLNQKVSTNDQMIFFKKTIINYIDNNNQILDKDQYIKFINKIKTNISNLNLHDIYQELITDNSIKNVLINLSPIYGDIITNNLLDDPINNLLALDNIKYNSIKEFNNNTILKEYIHNLLRIMNYNDIVNFINLKENDQIKFKNRNIYNMIVDYMKKKNDNIETDNNIDKEVNQLLLNNINHPKWNNININFNKLVNLSTSNKIDLSNIFLVIKNYLTVVININNQLKGPLRDNKEIIDLLNSNINSCNLYLEEKVEEISKNQIIDVKTNVKVLNFKK